MKTCPKCGFQTTDESRFCMQCGNRFADINDTAVNPDGIGISDTPVSDTSTADPCDAPVADGTDSKDANFNVTDNDRSSEGTDFFDVPVATDTKQSSSFNPQPQNSSSTSANRMLDRFTTLFQTPILFTLAIISTISAVLSAYSLSILALDTITMILFTVGFWMIYGASKKTNTGSMLSGLNILKVTAVIRLVVVCISCGLALLIIVAASAISCAAEPNFGMVFVAFIVMLIIIAIVAVPPILLYSFEMKLFDSVSKSIKTDTDAVSMAKLAAVLSVIYAVFMGIVAILSFIAVITVDPLSLFSTIETALSESGATSGLPFDLDSVMHELNIRMLVYMKRGLIISALLSAHTAAFYILKAKLFMKIDSIRQQK